MVKHRHFAEVLSADRMLLYGICKCEKMVYSADGIEWNLINES